MYKAIIVDDEQMIINSLALGFDWKAHGYEIAATCTRSIEALSLIEFIRPDVVFTDIKMPSLSGIELMQKIHQTLPYIQFVLISGYADFRYAQQAIQEGASGYCLKPLEDEDIEAALNNVTRQLIQRQTLLESCLKSLLQTPTLSSAQVLLKTLFTEKEFPEQLTVLLSIGSADFLLSGNVCYYSIPICEDCYLYLISTGDDYLSSIKFRTALLRAVSEQQIKAVTWQSTDDPAVFLSKNLSSLFDSLYSYFTGQPVTLGTPVLTPELIDNSEFLKTISVLANKGRITDVMETLSSLTEACSSVKPSDAVQLYNLCNAMLCRAENTDWSSAIRYPYELTSKFTDLNEMLNELKRKMESVSGSVNPESVNNETFRKILDYINHHFTEPISFQDISTEYSINSSYLSQLFKKELGVTFTSYLTNLRIQYAKELLETTTLRISEIPEKIGYGYDYNFAKLFKKETGLTPREYREKYKKI